MAEFERNLHDECISCIMQEPWWDVVRHDNDLFFAIRDRYGNIYYKGNSLAKIVCANGNINIHIHYKYLLKPQMNSPYINTPFTINDGNKGFFDEFFNLNINTQQTIDQLKRASIPYAGSEKIGVHEILKTNRNNVIDVEITLSQQINEEEDQIETTEYPGGQQEEQVEEVFVEGVRRIDFAAFIESKNEIFLRFYEAKHFRNPEIRANETPQVIHQLNEYENLLNQNQQNIHNSYYRVCQIYLELNGIETPHIISEIANGNRDFIVDPIPKLVVFGYDADQIREGANGRMHLERLKNEFNVILLKKGNPNGLVLE